MIDRVGKEIGKGHQQHAKPGDADNRRARHGADRLLQVAAGLPHLRLDESELLFG